MKRQLKKNQIRGIVFATILLNLSIIIPFRIIFHNSALFEPALYFLVVFNALVFGLLFPLGKAMLYSSIALIVSITAEYWNNLFGIYVVMIDGEKVPTFILFLAKAITFSSAILLSLLLIYLIQKYKKKHLVEKSMIRKLEKIGG